MSRDQALLNALQAQRNQALDAVAELNAELVIARYRADELEKELAKFRSEREDAPQPKRGLTP